MELKHFFVDGYSSRSRNLERFEETVGKFKRENPNLELIRVEHFEYAGPNIYALLSFKDNILQSHIEDMEKVIRNLSAQVKSLQAELDLKNSLLDFCKIPGDSNPQNVEITLYKGVENGKLED